MFNALWYISSTCSSKCQFLSQPFCYTREIKWQSVNFLPEQNVNLLKVFIENIKVANLFDIIA